MAPKLPKTQKGQGKKLTDMIEDKANEGAGTNVETNVSEEVLVNQNQEAPNQVSDEENFENETSEQELLVTPQNSPSQSSSSKKNNKEKKLQEAKDLKKKYSFVEK